jgi:parallel beta-helix repeat protein
MTISKFKNGVWLKSSLNNSIVGNNIANNFDGVAIGSSSSNNSISGNNIADNFCGVAIGSSSNNAFCQNNFVDNNYQAYIELGSVDIWDDGYPSGGNYWSDYLGVDFYSGLYQNETYSDGIGDTPYTIDGNNVDNYPLMIPWECPVSYQSNTTITNVVVTGKSLSFETSGPYGTTGFINVTMRMDFNSTTIKVFVDDVEITPTITTNGIHYFIYFEFTQSIHNIIIKCAIVDIALTDLVVSKTVVGQGYCMNISVTAENHGSFTENFILKVYANTTIIDTKPATITAWSSTTVIFTWYTTGFPKGNYSITAYATPVQGETATTDNTIVADECVFITIPGDLDADFDVDLFDAIKLLVIYGDKIGDPEYDLVCDIDCDGDIDLYDAVILLTHYGQKDP